MKQGTAAFVADASPNRKQICGSMELESGDYISYTVSECRDLASVKNLFRRNCTVLLDHHPCEITKLNGSKHDLKPLISSGPSASENYFIAGFSIRMGVDIKPLKVGRERELCGPKGWGSGNILQNELLKRAISSSEIVF